MGENREGWSRNIYKGHTDKDKADRIEGGRWGCVVKQSGDKNGENCTLTAIKKKQ